MADNGFMDALKREAEISEVAEEAVRMIETQQVEIERLRVAGDRLAIAAKVCWCGMYRCAACEARAAWRETRHG